MSFLFLVIKVSHFQIPTEFLGLLITIIILFIYFWLHQVFAAVVGLSLVAVSEGYSFFLRATLQFQCVGFSYCEACGR